MDGPPKVFAVRIVAMVAAFVALDYLYLRLTQLPEESYAAPVIALQLFVNPLALAALVLPAGFLAARWRRLSWRELGVDWRLRLLLCAPALILAWSLSTVERNEWFDRWHAVDRLLVVALAGAFAAHPWFAAVLLPISAAMMGQFKHPIGGLAWTEPRLAFAFLALFVAYLGLRWFRRESANLLVLCLLALFGSYYVWSGLAKLPLGWFPNDDLGNLLAASHLNGWLGGAQPESILGAAASIRSWSVPLLGLGLLVELAPLGLLARRVYAVAAVGACAVLHLGIFALSGILFFQWILLGLALMAFLGSMPRPELFGVRRCVVASVVLMAGAPLFFKPPRLAWLDTRLNVSFELEAVGESGRAYPVERGAMAPYDTVFGRNRFHYLTDAPQVVGSYGGTDDLEIFRKLQSGERAGLGPGAVEFDAERAERFDRLVRALFQREFGRSSWVHALAPPPHLWSSVRGEPYRGQEPVKEIRVRRIETRIRPDRFEVVEDRVVRVIPR